jgi:hypothetical protein
MTWAPRCLVIPLPVPVEAKNFNQVSMFIRYLRVFCDTNSSYVQQQTDHGIVAGNITSISDS